MSSWLPVFPLGMVLFPGLVLPLHIFEERYRQLVRHLIGRPADAAREFGVVAIRSGWPGPPGAGPFGSAPIGQPPTTEPVTLHEVGCTTEVRQITELPDGRFDLVTVGRRRFRILRVDDRAAPYLMAEVEWLPEPTGQEETADLLAPQVLALFRRYLALIRLSDEEIPEQLPDNPTVLSHLVAATSALTVADRQSLLALPDSAARLRAELRLLSREVALLDQVRAVPAPLVEFAVQTSPN